MTFNFTGEYPLSQFNKTYAGAQYATFSAKAQVLRSDFGVDLCAPLTSDIIIEAELRQQE